ELQGTPVNAPSGKVELKARSDATITSVALGIGVSAISGGQSSSGFAFNGAGSVAYNDTTNSASAVIDGGSVSAGNDITLDAADSSHVYAVAGAGALTISSGTSGLHGALGVSVAVNAIHDTVAATIQGSSTLTAGGKVSASSSDDAQIHAWAIAGGGTLST